MKMKKLFLILASMLLLVSLCAGASAEVKYDVIKPAGFDSSMQRYPVVYVMPEDGYANSKTNPMAVQLQEAMRNGDGMGMLIVLPSFENGDNLHDELTWLVNEIDNVAFKNKTVADKKFRAIAGVNVGGYMAYASMLNASGAVADKPELFGFVASVRGRFAEDGNPWYAKCGSIFDKLNKAGKNVAANYFTYMDTPVDDPMANAKGSTNDMGRMFISWGTGADKHEYTARPGSYNGAFVKESASRIADRFTNYMMGTSTLYSSLSSVVVTSADSSAEVAYSVMPLGASYGGVFDKFDPMYAGAKATIKVAVVDPDTDKVLTSKSIDTTLRTWGSVAGKMDVRNATNGKTCEMKMYITVFGATFEVATANMVCIEDSVFNGEKQKIDLMGDWYFKYTGYKNADDYLDVPALTASKEYKSWSVVQPALGNWDNGYGNINGETVGQDPNSGYFNMMILGNGYYARDFVLPAQFTTQKPVISVGYIDDRCEVFVNGHRIGGTGIAADGSITNESDTWSLHSYFEVDPAILNYGGENTIVVRAWNNTGMGAGGWYAGPVAIYSEEAFNDQGGAYTDRFYEETYYSEAVGKEMQYLIYLPKSYSKNGGFDGKYYPTMYLLHQFSSSHTSYMVDGVNKLLDEAIEAGLLDDMIVVIPNSDPMSWWAGKWEKMLTEDLIAHIDANYRTVKDARYRFTAGCSMGGLGAAATALKNPNTFSGFASFYGAFSYGDWMGSINPVTLAKKDGADEYLKYFDMSFICGNQDSYGFGAGMIDLTQKLEEYGIDHQFLIENGGHDGAFYLPRFKDTLSYVWQSMKADNALLEENLDLDKMLYASLENTGDGLVLVSGANDKLTKYFNQVPTLKNTSYTKDATPALSIPLRVIVTQNGQKYTLIARDHEIDPDTMDCNVMELNAEDFVPMNGGAAAFDPSKKFTYTIKAIVFDNEYGEETLRRTPDEILLALSLPETGDNSSMMLYALLMVVSAGVCAQMMSKKSRA
ncbi:MAG: hypothetical protein IKU38_04030 [Clostridia bacterium]|nr:hypothetical protein [Clostridia bacterium]